MNYQGQHSYSNTNYNRPFVASRNRNRRFTQTSQNMNLHFQNIHLLAQTIQQLNHTIQYSQQLLLPPPPQFTPNQVYPPQGQGNVVLQFESLFSTNQHRTPDATQELSYNILHVDEANIHEIDVSQSNYHLYDISGYSIIPQPLNDICPITRESFEPTQSVCMVARCKHIFNKPTLMMWVENNNTCPSCRCAIRD